jgi:hypothetical protein
MLTIKVSKPRLQIHVAPERIPADGKNPQKSLTMWKREWLHSDEN